MRNQATFEIQYFYINISDLIIYLQFFKNTQKQNLLFVHINHILE